MNLPYVLADEYKRDEIQANFDALAMFAPAASLSEVDVTDLRRLSALIKSGTGNPEGNVDAPVGTLYLRTDGGAGSTLYVKESGTGDTGWDSK